MASLRPIMVNVPSVGIYVLYNQDALCSMEDLEQMLVWGFSSPTALLYDHVTELLVSN
jgi:hypothetical protein